MTNRYWLADLLHKETNRKREIFNREVLNVPGRSIDYDELKGKLASHLCDMCPDPAFAEKNIIIREVVQPGEVLYSKSVIVDGTECKFSIDWHGIETYVRKFLG